jgi:hypothetical protein
MAVRLSALRTSRVLLSRNIIFLLLVFISVGGRNVWWSWKKFIHVIGSRTRALPATALTTTLPRAPAYYTFGQVLESVSWQLHPQANNTPCCNLVAWSVGFKWDRNLFFFSIRRQTNKPSHLQRDVPIEHNTAAYLSRIVKEYGFVGACSTFRNVATCG